MNENQRIRQEIAPRPWKSITEPWKTILGPPKSIPRAWDLFQNKRNHPQNAISGFLKGNIKNSVAKSQVLCKNQGFHGQIKQINENITIGAPAQKAYKTQGKWRKIKGFDRKSLPDHGKASPNHEKLSSDRHNPSPKLGTSSKTKGISPKTLFPDS